MKKTVLVIEDDPDILENLAEFLESEGYVAEKTTNGKEALEFLRTAQTLPSAIVLDLMMPVMDGFQFREAQEKDPRIAAIPIVLVSADNQVEIKRLRMGAVEYVKKPIDIDLLSEKLKKLV